MKRWMALILTIVAAGAGFVVYEKHFAWKRFDVVADGEIYRSGLLTESQLAQAIDRYQIKTVFSFTFSKHDAHEHVCDEKGVRRYFAYLPGDGVGPDDPYLRFLEIASDPAHRPILVHCSAGVQRTGGAVALYRSVVQGWDFDKAIEEMIDHGNEGLAAQIDQLRQLHVRLVSSDRCLLNLPKVASTKR
jgi:protein tyrosine/serine phosphatase